MTKGPFFDGCPDHMVLDRSDCAIVQAIHMPAESVRTIGRLKAQFRTNRKSGHCDYWINCGFSQHPCSGSTFTEVLNSSIQALRGKTAKAAGNMTKVLTCAHSRSPEVYISQLSEKCDFMAQSCLDASGQDTCANGKNCNTNGQDDGFSLIHDACWRLNDGRR